VGVIRPLEAEMPLPAGEEKEEAKEAKEACTVVAVTVAAAAAEGTRFR